MDKFTLLTHTYQKNHISASLAEWRVRGLRGATTVSQNSAQAIAEAVDELLNALEANNPLDPAEIVSVTFSATPDLDAIFPAAVARQRPGWDQVPLLDVQQMQVNGSLKCCIRVLIHLNTPILQNALRPVYLRGAAQLRPDIARCS
ncbi:MAG: chorismate mutase [Nostoc sp. DedVER02]|uniref:chorismate mutase n=1 Tax=unclassified Nostoc TaxID=2593658 RepID=UPI002AD441B3|nr:MULTISPECIES: chorismate mutase [unclassified Nostoc]MDZ7990269.1 chorismate mutase [Nostoc sp. DedVER02]MDZ8114827.1 chorismate mutase [Nostoc sp. DedVER01b]